jgi:phosphoglycerate dehydrogenase-like enzyme
VRYIGEIDLIHKNLNLMPNLKWIHLSKTGYGKFNFPERVTVTNTPDSSNGVAEFAISIILMLLRGLDRMTIDRKAFDNNVDYILPFSKVNVLVVGFGNIGKEILLKLTV